MKKLILIMMAFMASFSVYAQEVNIGSNDKVTTTSYVQIIATFRIDISEIVYPYIIDIPAPQETVIGVSGPTDPLLQTWRVENGRLIIELHEEDMCDVRAGNTHHLSLGFPDPEVRKIIVLIIE